MKNKKGFTIVELVIVIAVIAILAAVLIPTFSGVVSKANDSAALQTARSSLTNALNMSTTAQLAGQDEDGYHTVFLVSGHAFGYTGNELKAINYPGYKDTAKLSHAHFNAFILSTEDVEITEAQDAVVAKDATYTAAESTATWMADTYFVDDNGTPVADKDAFDAVTDKTTLYVVDQPAVQAKDAVPAHIIIREDVVNIIIATTDSTVTKDTVVPMDENGNYKFGEYSFYLNSDFAKGVVVATEFAS